jgi:hypothetical protein
MSLDKNTRRLFLRVPLNQWEYSKFAGERSLHAGPLRMIVISGFRSGSVEQVVLKVDGVTVFQGYDKKIDRLFSKAWSSLVDSLAETEVRDA